MKANSKTVFQELRKVIPNLPSDVISLTLSIGVGEVPLVTYKTFVNKNESDATIEQTFVMVSNEEYEKVQKA